MRRGTRVASAYASITADGDGINEAIVDAVDDAGDDIDGKGTEHGEKYGNEFSEGFLSRMRTKISGRLGNVMNSRDAAASAGDEAGESFVDRMVAKTSTLGDKIGAELSDRLASNPEQVRRGIERAFDDDFADRIGERLGSRVVSGMTDAIDRQSDTLGLAISEALEGAVSRNRSAAGKDSGFSALIGRMFGAGSRNNALNILGKTIGNVVGLVEKGAGFAKLFGEGMAAAGEGASLIARLGGGFSKSFGSLSTSFATLGASAPMLLAGLTAVLLVMSALVSVAGALLAIVTALASTIASALVGALAVAGPLLGALAVAGGLVTAAFTSMTEAQRTYLGNAFQPLKAAMTGIGQIIMTQFIKPLYNGQSAIQVWSANLQQAILPLAGVARSTAEAFAEAGNTITASLSGAGFQRFFDSLRIELPTIVRNLSSALGGFLNGMAGTFAAIMPYVTQFSGYLAEVAARFSKWVNSAKGQNSISDFVGRAVESLKSLWGFLKEVGGLLSDIFFDKRSQQAGNNIFDSMRREVERFREKLKGVDLEKWFDDAIKWGKKMWRGLKDIATVIKRLYDDGTLTAVGTAFEEMAGFVKDVSDALSPLVNLMKNDLVEALGTIVSPLSNITGLMEGAAAAARDLQSAWDAMTGAPNLDGPSAPAAPSDPWDTDTPYPQARYNMASRGGRRRNRRGGRTLDDVISAKRGELDDLIAAGNDALNATYESNGGYMPDPDSGGKNGDKSDEDKKKDKKDKFTKFVGQMVDDWKNPYVAFANAIMAQAPTLAEELREAGRQARETLREAMEDATEMFADLKVDLGIDMIKGVNEAAQSFSADDVIASLSGIVEQTGDAIRNAVSGNNDAAAAARQAAYDTANAGVQSAQAARNQAAADLAAAKTPKQAERALAKLQQADRDLAVAKAESQRIRDDADRTYASMIAAGNASSAAVDRARKIVSDQAIVTVANVEALVAGAKVANATLADYAAARGQVADMLADANQRLTEAIALRDNYATEVGDSLRQFGSLISAQAKVINGVQQSLTADDITSNLQDRLDKIRKFNDNMRLLLASGLSDAAYKQIVDAGVETGGAYAEAILAGGQGAISEVNNLTGQIDAASTSLGNAAANQLYQAGVAAATGLYNGLVSLSNDLTSAATALGAAIANAIKRELGIASPSRVLFDMMKDDVGDGAANGLLAAQPKVAAAASALAAQVAVSPEVAAYAARQGTSATTDDGLVSGNGDGPKFLWTGDIVTPTEDPVAVANEAINEITARLP